MPIAITIFRLFLIIPVIYLLEEGHRNLAGILIIIAGISDRLDGELARRTNSVSKFGLLLDPFADKVFVLCVLSYFLYEHEVSLLPFALLLFRELSVSFLRSLAVEKGYTMSASYIGKTKTVFEFLSLVAICFGHGYADNLLWFAVLLAYVSMYDYMIKYLTFEERKL